MPGVTQCESQTVLAKASPTRKNRLSLRFFQKKETKRTLDFAETPQAESQNVEEKEPEASDQVVPAAQLSPPPVCCVKKEGLVPFVGFSNLGNTCYLNSVLQVLCYCPRFKSGIKHLCDVISKKRETFKDDKEHTLEKDSVKEDLPASYDVICSLSSLVHSAEHLQLNFLLNPENYDSELAAQPRRLLGTLRELNPMYEGYLQHDAQEVLQCILGNIQEACQALKKEMKSLKVPDAAKPQPEKGPNPGESPAVTMEKLQDDSSCAGTDAETNASGKRKNETEVGNAKKRTKISKEPPPEEQRVTRSKRKPDKQDDKVAGSKTSAESSASNPTHKKSRLGLNWLKSGKQPSILSKFCNLSRSSSTSPKSPPAEHHTQSINPEAGRTVSEEPVKDNDDHKQGDCKDTETSQNESTEFDLVEKLFQGQLVLRTRCLECECFTERREDFQDISVPVQENDPPKLEESSDISPDPRMEIKTLKWAISQFASVERIVGEDKYFCENCHHYTEAERSLLFDKIPEIVTIHLKCFAANSSEFDSYGGLSKVNTPLLTPLQLSLEEWSTKPSKDLYGLFGVVMHSGVTISSGHYTAYVKLDDLQNFELDQIKSPSTHHNVIKTEPLSQDVQASDENHDGEISFRASTSVPSSSKVNKKGSDAVGLLGGQKSKSDFEQLPTAKTPKTERVSSCLSDDKGLSDANGDLHSDSEQKVQSISDGLCSSKSAAHLLHILKEYEGKWLLFDDSEVKVTEERDFLTTISPSTQSTSTPYLLFYRRLTE
ncbi:PREDICTED: ubiquitin carboxyl-terminal hydrolase 1 [Nanorana parkeri]|uniref:ubiquitin carboxyl-terminal hydrolase 1 n=1 Tax=Nanorana parkeri TaxID=125878 RepID=UPI0008542A6B|nr:PREDICTED: ubiquitin carboxyl-terminal hydrolase 1 [Nanorana parkeri]